MKCIFLVALFAFGTTSAQARAADDATQLKQLSQAFSDASASNDTKALDRMLDDRVIFMNESGDIATKKDIVGDAPATPAPKTTNNNVLVQTDWKLELHGNVAVTSFTDNGTFHFHEQVTQARFRSTEVWLKEADAWRMISSQTLALPDAPPAIHLPVTALDEYAGTYSAGADAMVRISRQGDALVSSTNNAKATPLDVEVHDVLFTPSQPRIRRIFERDGNGHVTGFLARREGHDIRFQRVG
ncbi:nuclear transport factor 2 family protein [Rhodanobacter sp. L36]|uniref:nuclear transport factor 2 family protein n=1 Tax=Rhodanobacter sp. L36 TaxID=1747221 RepID=UPI00131DA022|nr:nuclear transport factor 2 family protein [Rhodanobacter sp. L36]